MSFSASTSGLHIPERRQRFPDNVVGEVIYDVLLEVRLAPMKDADLVALLMREVVKCDAEHVHFHASGHQRDGGAHILEDAGVVCRAIAVRTSSISRSGTP